MKNSKDIFPVFHLLVLKIHLTITRLNKYCCSRITVVLSTLNNAVSLLEISSDAFRHAQNNNDEIMSLT